MIFIFPIIAGVGVGGWFALCCWIGSRQVGWTRYFFLWLFNRWGPEEKKISITAGFWVWSLFTSISLERWISDKEAAALMVLVTVVAIVIVIRLRKQSNARAVVGSLDGRSQ